MAGKLILFYTSHVNCLNITDINQILRLSLWIIYENTKLYMLLSSLFEKVRTCGWNVRPMDFEKPCVDCAFLGVSDVHLTSRCLLISCRV